MLYRLFSALEGNYVYSEAHFNNIIKFVAKIMGQKKDDQQGYSSTMLDPDVFRYTINPTTHRDTVSEFIKSTFFLFSATCGTPRNIGYLTYVTHRNGMTDNDVFDFDSSIEKLQTARLINSDEKAKVLIASLNKLISQNDKLIDKSVVHQVRNFGKH
jgi:hypothetical protein